MKTTTNFYNLDPNLILEVAENEGYVVTGEMTQLNSYENRVFDIKLDSTERNSLIAKFYRPRRWTKSTLLDEHSFLKELHSEGIAVAPTLPLQTSSESVSEIDGIYYSFFEKVRGRLLQELTIQHYKKIGRWLARLHNVGAKKPAANRPYLGPTNDNKWPLLEKLLLQVAPEVALRYEEAAVRIFELLDSELIHHNSIRVHGDLHRGNILENANGEFVVVDFDDMVNAPEVQDFWMLMPSSETDSAEFNALIQAYEELREFPYEQISLIPLLRGYRIVNYAIWIMNRWNDPSFKKIFPDFGSYTYWAEEAESLEKISNSI
jgi:Ser/Thr protein kinase RdoA (MazF antagonist)